MELLAAFEAVGCWAAKLSRLRSSPHYCTKQKKQVLTTLATRKRADNVGTKYALMKKAILYALAIIALFSTVFGCFYLMDRYEAAKFYTIDKGEISEILATYPFRTNGCAYAVTAKGDTVMFHTAHVYDTWGVRDIHRNWCDGIDSIKVRPATIHREYYKNSTAFRWDE